MKDEEHELKAEKTKQKKYLTMKCVRDILYGKLLSVKWQKRQNSEMIQFLSLFIIFLLRVVWRVHFNSHEINFNTSHSYTRPMRKFCCCVQRNQWGKDKQKKKQKQNHVNLCNYLCCRTERCKRKVQNDVNKFIAFSPVDSFRNSPRKQN